MNALIKIDSQIIALVDGFCTHIQTRVHYVWMMTIFTFGTASIALAASVRMSQGWGAAQFAWPLLWSIGITLMTIFFWRTLWRDVRNWSPSTQVHWMTMAAMMRENGRMIRAASTLGTLFLALWNLPFLVYGDRDLALMSYKFLFVSMFPITLMMYVYCAMPVPTKVMIDKWKAEAPKNSQPD